MRAAVSIDPPHEQVYLARAFLRSINTYSPPPFASPFTFRLSSNCLVVVAPALLPPPLLCEVIYPLEYDSTTLTISGRPPPLVLFSICFR